MGPFVCKSCSAPSDQASRCPVCGGRTFELSAESRQAAESALRGARAGGQLVPITDAPSLRRRRRHRAAG